jgi:hypothetical protein
MGYSGRIAVVRSSPASLQDAEVLHETAFQDGWRRLQFDGDVSTSLDVLVKETGAPALWAFVLDSDLADVVGLTPGGAEWHTYLHENTAMEFGAPELPQSADEVARLAVEWSAEAGLIADPEAVRAALDAHNVFAEETLTELTKALGLRAAE